MIQEALQTALADYLRASAIVAAAFPGGASRVHDRPPLDPPQTRMRETPVFPYLRIGAIDCRPADLGACLRRRTASATIEAYSREASALEVRRILDAAEAALDDAALAVAGWSVQPVEIVSSESDLADDGLTYAGALVVRVEATRDIIEE